MHYQADMRRISPNALYAVMWTPIDNILKQHGQDRTILARPFPPHWRSPRLSAEEIAEPEPQVEGRVIQGLQSALQSLSNAKVSKTSFAVPVSDPSLARRVPFDFPKVESLKKAAGLTWVTLGLDNSATRYRSRSGHANATLASIVQAAEALSIQPFDLVDMSRLTPLQGREIKRMLSAMDGPQPRGRPAPTPNPPPTMVPPQASSSTSTETLPRGIDLLSRLHAWRERHEESSTTGVGCQNMWFQLHNITYECLWVPFRRRERSLEDTMVHWCTFALPEYHALLRDTPPRWRKYANPALHVGDRRFQDLVRRLAKPGRTLSIAAARLLFEEFRFE